MTLYAWEDGARSSWRRAVGDLASTCSVRECPDGRWRGHVNANGRAFPVDARDRYEAKHEADTLARVSGHALTSHVAP